MPLTDFDLVEKYWTEDGAHCSECAFCRTWQEPRGEHFGTPCSETISECAVVEGQFKITDCPMLVELQERANAQG